MSVHPLPAPPAPAPPLSLVDQRWEQDILPLLPPACWEQAHRLGAFTRTRALAHPAALLRGLLAYVLCCGSFRFLGAWALLLGLADISDTAWRNRFLHASPWLEWLLQTLIAAPPAAPAAPAPDPDAPPRRRIRFIDATIIRHPSGQGEDWRCHMSYEALAQHLATVKLTDDHTAEDFAHSELQPGDIGVGDAGHGRRRIIVAAATHADIVVRIHPRTCPLETVDGTEVDVVEWLRSQKGRFHERALYCRDGRRRVAVRLLAMRLSDAARAKAQRRKRRKAKQDGRQITAETLFLAGWVLVVTTLPAAEWPAEAVLRLYRARWQIELLFKRMKQQIQLADVRVRNRARAEAVIRAKLVAWALAERLSGGLWEVLPGGRGTRGRPVSSWGVSGLATTAVRAAVQGGWSWARVLECGAQLERYVCSSPRAREHQETRVRDWILRRQAAQERDAARARDELRPAA